MAKATEESSVTKRLAAEHRHLSKAAQQVRALARDEVTPEGFDFWRRDLESRLKSFRELLTDHFEHEEHGGFLRDVLREVPNSQAQVERLREEHGNIERRIDALLAELDELDDVTGAEALQGRVMEVTEVLAQHETEEQHLVQRTYYREYGAGD